MRSFMLSPVWVTHILIMLNDCPGPVSHYTNLILKEMGRNEPFRTSYAVPE